MVAHHPLHSAGRAAFPHPALASGNTKAPQRIGVTDTGRRQPACVFPVHPVPEDMTVLAPRRYVLSALNIRPCHCQRFDAILSNGSA